MNDAVTLTKAGSLLDTSVGSFWLDSSRWRYTAGMHTKLEWESAKEAASVHSVDVLTAEILCSHCALALAVH